MLKCCMVSVPAFCRPPSRKERNAEERRQAKAKFKARKRRDVDKQIEMEAAEATLQLDEEEYETGILKKRERRKKERRSDSTGSLFPELVDPADERAVEEALKLKKSVFLKHALPLVKSSTDSNQYRPICLANGMKVLLINDKAALRSTAALSVAIGSL